MPINCLEDEHLPLMLRALIPKVRSCCSDIQEGNAEVLLQGGLLVISDLMLQLGWLTLPLKIGCSGALYHGEDLFELSCF